MQCLECEKRISGTARKKFCSVKCRVTYGRKKKATDAFMNATPVQATATFYPPGHAAMQVFCEKNNVTVANILEFLESSMGFHMKYVKK